jgi:prepilin-type N-terminal cleavage/methylation domain-containing protein
VGRSTAVRMVGRTIGRTADRQGFTAIELLFALAVATTIVAMAIPLTTSSVDEIRTAMAARYLAGQIVTARLNALRRSTCVALRFEPAGADYAFGAYADGNRNGVRTADIASGIDPPLVPRERLGDRFAEVRFGLAAGVPDLDGTEENEEGDGVRVGSARILTLSPDGTATSGTVYIRGRRSQYAVRILGATARTRVFQYHRGTREWIAR